MHQNNPTYYDINILYKVSVQTSSHVAKANECRKESHMKEFDQIIGYASTKKELIRIADILRNEEPYAKLGVSVPKGLLLYGEAGVGKTLMANCLIQASGRKVFTCRKNQPDGDFTKAVQAIFAEAAANAPSIVF